MMHKKSSEGVLESKGFWPRRWLSIQILLQEKKENAGD
jgi:hypothetical protein